MSTPSSGHTRSSSNASSNVPSQAKRKTAADYPSEVMRLFDQYVHGLLERRGFLQSAAKYTAGIVAAETLLAELSPNFAHAQQVKGDDSRLLARHVEIPSPQGYGTVRGYLVQPVGASEAKAKLPTVLVVHENRGLNPHIEDVARRLALENFIAFAPDALFPHTKARLDRAFVL